MAKKMYIPSDYGRLDEPCSCSRLFVDIGDGNGPVEWTGETIDLSESRFGAWHYVSLHVWADDKEAFVPFEIDGQSYQCDSDDNCQSCFCPYSTQQGRRDNGPTFIAVENNGWAFGMFTTLNADEAAEVGGTVTWRRTDGCEGCEGETEGTAELSFRIPKNPCTVVESWIVLPDDGTADAHWLRPGHTALGETPSLAKDGPQVLLDDDSGYRYMWIRAEVDPSLVDLAMLEAARMAFYGEDGNFLVEASGLVAVEASDGTSLFRCIVQGVTSKTYPMYGLFYLGFSIDECVCSPVYGWREDVEFASGYECIPTSLGTSSSSVIPSNLADVGEYSWHGNDHVGVEVDNGANS